MCAVFKAFFPFIFIYKSCERRTRTNTPVLIYFPRNLILSALDAIQTRMNGCDTIRSTILSSGRLRCFFHSLNQLCYVRRSSRPKLIYRIDQYANSRPAHYACLLAFLSATPRVRVSTAGLYAIIYRQIGFKCVRLCVKAAKNVV